MDITPAKCNIMANTWTYTPGITEEEDATFDTVHTGHVD